MTRKWLFVPLLLATSLVLADDVPEREARVDETVADDDVSEAKKVEDTDEAQPRTKEGAKVISGMSILGNQEAPKSLVIVPWRTSVLGDSIGISTMLDDSKQPIDREVFMRALKYYEIRSEVTP